MKKIFLSLFLAATVVAAIAADKSSGVQLPEPVSDAADAFVKMPTITLDILSTSMRKDMLDYYKVDSIYNVMNSMEGFSHINPPVLHDYIQVQITPVTKYTVRILPLKKDSVIMTLYTVGDSIQAEDTEIKFYDMNLNELKRDKFIKTLSTADFLDLNDVDGKLSKELKEIVPFPTVKYSIAPEGDIMRAELTVGEFLSREALEKISPYIRRNRDFKWNGSKWELLKLPKDSKTTGR